MARCSVQFRESVLGEWPGRGDGDVCTRVVAADAAVGDPVCLRAETIAEEGIDGIAA